jgi:hypothetical protein
MTASGDDEPSCAFGSRTMAHAIEVDFLLPGERVVEMLERVA